jgi:hypothetical protein
MTVGITIPAANAMLAWSTAVEISPEISLRRSSAVIPRVVLNPEIVPGKAYEMLPNTAPLTALRKAVPLNSSNSAEIAVSLVVPVLTPTVTARDPEIAAPAFEVNEVSV